MKNNRKNKPLLLSDLTSLQAPSSLIYLLLLPLLCLLYIPITSAQTPANLPSISEVMKHQDDLYRSDSSHSRIKMEVSTKRWERTMEMEGWSLGKDLSLIVIRAPSREKGTATLKKADGLWSYAPRADRLVRVPSGMLSDGWMGSHITNDDLMRETSVEEDYETTLKWVERDNTTLLLATMIPRPGTPIVYSKVTYLMSAKTWIPIETAFYDGNDLVRTIRYSKVRTFDGRKIPSLMEVIPADNPGEFTKIEYLELELDAKVNKRLFTPRGLRRAAQR